MLCARPTPPGKNQRQQHKNAQSSNPATKNNEKVLEKITCPVVEKTMNA